VEAFVVRSLSGAATARWSAWFGEEPSSLEFAVLASARAAPRRGVVLARSRSGRVAVMKVALEPAAEPALRREQEVLEGMTARSVTAHVRLPQVLDAFSVADRRVLATSFVGGCHYVLPRAGEPLTTRARRNVDAFLSAASTVGSLLDHSTEPAEASDLELSDVVDEFLTNFPDLRRAVESSSLPSACVGVSVRTAWQHADIAEGNLLRQRGRPVGVVDWELAGHWYPWWFDRWYALLGLALLGREVSAGVRQLAVLDRGGADGAQRSGASGGDPRVRFPAELVVTAMIAGSRAMAKGRGSAGVWGEVVRELVTASDQEMD
jgi:hypothetical protein